MAVVTLTSDFGENEHYVAILKASLLQKNPQVHIQDISNNIEAFNHIKAAHILKNAFSFFPEGSVHLLLVNIFTAQDSRLLYVHHQNHVFVFPDNGVLPLLFEQIPQIFVYRKSEPLDLLDMIKTVAELTAKLMNGEQAGSETTNYVSKIELKPLVYPGMIKGLVLYHDRFGNAITNIDRKLFEETVGDKKFEIVFNRHRVLKISKNYNEVSEGQQVAIFNSSGMLEIACNLGNAMELYGLDMGKQIMISF